MLIRTRQLRKTYKMGNSTVQALSGVDLDITAGQFVSITGASGSGKSTLMHLLGCLDRPSSGTYELDGQLVNRMSSPELARIRNRRIGFVFQTFNLIQRTNALDNVAVPLIYGRVRGARKKAMQALETVGVAQRWNHTPAEMSGGERQRVAIARAVVNHPAVILADEPTGNLDSRTGDQILGIFHKLHQSGTTIILVTHEMPVAARAQRLIHISDGVIVTDVPVTETLRRELVQSALLGAPPFEGHLSTETAGMTT